MNYHFNLAYLHDSCIIEMANEKYYKEIDRDMYSHIVGFNSEFFENMNQENFSEIAD